MTAGKVGAQLYTVRAFVQTAADLAETLEKVAAIGYTDVQISALGAIHHKEVATMVEDNGLTVSSTHTGWERLRNELDVVVEEHMAWHCQHVAIPMLPREYYSLDGLSRFLDELAPISQALAREGLDISYHNHSHELARYGGQTWLAMLYEQADPAMLKAEIDTYWIQAGGGDPAAWIRELGDRQPLLHLKDMVPMPDREQRMAEIGEGNLNWPPILQAAAEVGVAWYLVEQDHCYDRDPFESLAISYHNLRAMGLS